MAAAQSLDQLLAPAGYLRQSLDCLGASAGRRQEILEAAGLSEADIEFRDGRMPVAVQIALIGAFNRVVGDDWAIDAGLAWRPASQGALEVAMRTAPTIGDALQLIERFGRVRAPQFVFRLAARRGEVVLRLDPAVDLDTEIIRPMSEAAGMSIAGLMHEVFGRPRDEFYYEWPWPAPAHADRLEAALGGGCCFERAHCAVVMPASICAIGSQFADRELHSTALMSLEQAARSVEAPSARARLQALFAASEAELPGADEAAAALGMSRRTLARRLAEEGASFRSERDEALKTRAQKLIEEGALKRDEIAERLGFEDPTSFSRACRRWFGASMRDVKNDAD